MSADIENDPILGADFAERVLARADVVVLQRRRTRRVLGGIAALVFVSVGVVSWVAMPAMMPTPVAHQNSDAVAIADPQAETVADEPDALSDLFPDAEPVARFATEYSDATSGEDTSLLSDQDQTS